MKLQLESDDYIYTIAFPHLDMLEMVAPEQRYVLEIETESPGTFDLLGSQFCGFAHPDLLAELVVHSRDEFDQWLREETSPRPIPVPPWTDAE